MQTTSCFQHDSAPHTSTTFYNWQISSDFFIPHGSRGARDDLKYFKIPRARSTGLSTTEIPRDLYIVSLLKRQ